MSDIDLTVVVTTYNRADLIDETMAALADQRWEGDWDVLVVDNGSTDETAHLAEAWFPKLPVPGRLIVADRLSRVSYARNVAVASTTASNVAFVDDDDLVGDGWVAAVGNALEEHQFVASRMDFSRLNPSQFADTAHFQTKRLGKHFGADVVDSAGSGISTELWRSVGGNDESLKNGEDTEFALRVAALGVQPQFCSEAVYHARLRSCWRPAFRRGLGRGRAEVQIFERHGETFAVRADNPVKAFARWVRLLLRSHWLLEPGRRVVWAENAGRRLGRLHASLSGGTWFP